MRTMMMALGLVVCGSAWAKPSEVITKVSAADVMSMVSQGTKTVEKSTDAAGDPMLTVTRDDGYRYAVYFYGCTDEVCGSFQLRSWWKAEGAVPSKAIHAYEIEKRVGRLYIDGDGDPTFEVNVWLDGGVTKEHLQAMIQSFLDASQTVGARIRASLAE